MQRAQPAHLHIMPQDPRTLTGMQCRMLRRLETPRLRLATHGEQAFHVAFQIEEIDLLTVTGPALRQTATAHQAAKHRCLLKCVQLTVEYQAGFDQAYPT